MKVSMIGLGYIGLPTAVVMANNGLDVIGVDVNKKVIDLINSKKINLDEPGLKLALDKALDSKKLSVSESPLEADVYMIAVPTPFTDDNKPDLAYVHSAVRSLFAVLKKNDLIIIESTCPVGTTDDVLNLIERECPHLKEAIKLAYCPERVIPGFILKEIVENDRVIGGVNTESTKAAIKLYKYFVKGKLHETNSKTAEMCKLTENASRDNQIAFANELSMICDEADINVYELINLANKHPRVNILNPGIGVGGHCIAVDPFFIIDKHPKESKIIQLARKTNDLKTEWVINKILNKIQELATTLKREPIVSCFGLAYKPNIDDIRESPAVKIVASLISNDVKLMVVEPHIKEHKSFTLYSAKEAIEKSDMAVFLVAHDQFRQLKIKNIPVVDFCNLK